MPTDNRPPELKAKEFAEKELGVNTAYQDALEAQTTYDEAMQKRDFVMGQIRTKRNFIADRETDVYQETVDANPGEKPTPLKEKVKTAVANDEQLRGLRAELANLQTEHDEAETAAESAKYKMRLYTARMEELAGLLQFYAAVKLTTIYTG